LPVIDSSGKKALFATPAHAKILAEYVSMFAADYFPADTLIRGYYGAVERYATGELAMLVTGPQFLTRIKREGPAVYQNTLIAAYPLSVQASLPNGKNKLIDAPLMNIAIPARSKKQAAAIAFALFVTDEANQVAFSRETVIFPSTKITDPVSKNFFLAGGNSPEDKARAIDYPMLEFAKDLAPTIPPDKSIDLARVFREAVESALYGTKTPAEALEFCAREWNRILAAP